MVKIAKVIFITFLIIAFVSLSSAATIKLLCINEGDKVLFSKCNALMADRTCTTSQGCRYCVSEIRSGVYCPVNLNECNGQGFTCQQDSNSNLPVDNSQNTDTNTNSNSNSNSNSNTNENTQESNQNSPLTVNINSKQAIQNNSNNENDVQITGAVSEDNISVKKSSIVQILTISFIIETVLIIFLLRKINRSKGEFQI